MSSTIPIQRVLKWTGGVKWDIGEVDAPSLQPMSLFCSREQEPSTFAEPLALGRSPCSASYVRPAANYLYLYITNSLPVALA